MYSRDIRTKGQLGQSAASIRASSCQGLAVGFVRMKRNANAGKGSQAGRKNVGRVGLGGGKVGSANGRRTGRRVCRQAGMGFRAGYAERRPMHALHSPPSPRAAASTPSKVLGKRCSGPFTPRAPRQRARTPPPPQHTSQAPDGMAGGREAVARQGLVVDGDDGLSEGGGEAAGKQRDSAKCLPPAPPRQQAWLAAAAARRQQHQRQQQQPQQ